MVSLTALFMKASFPSLAARRRRRRRLGASSRKATDSTLPLSEGYSDEENQSPHQQDFDLTCDDDDSSYSTSTAAYSSFSSSCLTTCFNSSDENLMDDSCRIYRKVLSQRKQDIGLETCFSRGAGTSSIQHTTTSSSVCNKNKKTRKRLRFAQVCAIVHEVPRNDELDEEEEEEGRQDATPSATTTIDPLQRYWWTDEECMRIRSEATRRIQYYRKNEPEFRQAIAVLANPHSCRQQIQEEMQEIALLHSTTRGFESHICDVLSEPRRAVMWAVLDKQDEMMDYKALQELGEQRDTTLIDENERSGKESRDNEDEADADVWLGRVREVSMAASLSSRTYATRMGEYDHTEALAAYDYMEAIKASASPHKVLR